LVDVRVTVSLLKLVRAMVGLLKLVEIEVSLLKLVELQVKNWKACNWFTKIGRTKRFTHEIKDLCLISLRLFIKFKKKGYDYIDMIIFIIDKSIVYINFCKVFIKINCFYYYTPL